MHGLMWLPLLAVFIGLAWAGWNEYQKVEVYRQWATGAEKAKYDIRAALKQQDQTLIWGTPSRTGILNQQTISVNAINGVNVKVDGQIISLDTPPENSTNVILELSRVELSPLGIPFTDITLAVQWAIALKTDHPASIAHE